MYPLRNKWNKRNKIEANVAQTKSNFSCGSCPGSRRKKLSKETFFGSNVCSGSWILAWNIRSIASLASKPCVRRDTKRKEESMTIDSTDMVNKLFWKRARPTTEIKHVSTFRLLFFDVCSWIQGGGWKLGGEPTRVLLFWINSMLSHCAAIRSKWDRSWCWCWLIAHLVIEERVTQSYAFE